MQTLTHEEFCERLNRRWPDRFQVLSEYHNTRTRLCVRCLICGFEFEARAGKLVYRGKCKRCGDKARQLTTDEFKRRLEERYPGRYEVLGEYTGWADPITVRCRLCGSEATLRATNFMYYGSCARCGRLAITKTHEAYLAEVAALYGDEYTLLGQYKSALTRIRIRHNPCGREYETQARALLLGCGCAVCAKQRTSDLPRKSQEEFEREVRQCRGDEYTVLGQYKTRGTPILVRHNPCGFEWKTRPANLLQGYSCPKCSRTGMSRVEARVHERLAELGVAFKYQARFPDCKGSRQTLPFDFRIETQRGPLLVELDGPMHYEERFGTLLQTMMADRIKDQFCKAKGIPLLRVPYWRFDKAPALVERWVRRIANTT